MLIDPIRKEDGFLSGPHHLVGGTLEYSGQSIQTERCLGKKQLEYLVVLGEHRLVAGGSIAVDEPDWSRSHPQRRHDRRCWLPGLEKVLLQSPGHLI